MPVYNIDEVGYWSEIKLNILREYADAFTQVLNKNEYIDHWAYIDGFAGAGRHRSRRTGEEIPGSPQVALDVNPPFSHYHFIDLSQERTDYLREIAHGEENVSIYQGDCNKVLLDDVFPKCKYEDYRRALCLLDPYDLNPNWQVVQKAAEEGSIEIIVNFMIMDANMNVLWTNPEKVAPEQAERMTRFWGDETWRRAAYRKQRGLFGDIEKKRTNQALAQAYRERLRDVAGFKYVPEPIPMRNSNGAPLYYLFFASQNNTGNKIATHVFNKWRDREL